MVRNNGKRILESVVNADVETVVNTDLLKQIFGSLNVLKELYRVETIPITDRLVYDNPQLDVLVNMLGKGQNFVLDIKDNNMITKRYVSTQGSVKIYSTPYDITTRAIVSVNNYMVRMGFAPQYFLNEATDEVLTTLNECFVANIDRL